MHFLNPTWLLLLIPVALLAATYAVLQFRRNRYAARFSNVALLGSVAPKRPGWRRHLTFALLIAGLTVLSIGVAQPTGKVRVPRDKATVIMAVDVSISMEATDVLPSRIEAAKQAAAKFVGLLPVKINLGLVSFGGSASLLVPPTLDRDSVTAAVDGLHLQESTAIGEAIYTSLQAIQSFNAATGGKSGDEPPPARIVLLSDGTNTVGRPVSQAVQAAKSAGVQVSTIAFGTDNGAVTYKGETIPVPADKQTLSQIASQTGGSFHTATSAQELEKVYADIGSQIGYTTEHRDISWRFLLVGVLLALGAATTSMLWAGRLA